MRRLTTVLNYSNRLRSLLIDLEAPSTIKLKSGDVSTVKGVVKGLISGQVRKNQWKGSLLWNGGCKIINSFPL